MASTNKTSLGLNMWEASDKPVRQDFVNDNVIVDEKISELNSSLDKGIAKLNSDIAAKAVQINWVAIEPLGASLNQCYVENNRIFFNYALYGADVRTTGQWTILGQVVNYAPGKRVYFPTTYTVQPDNISGNTQGVTGATGIGKFNESGQLLFFLPSTALSTAPSINCVHFNFSVRLSG